MSIILNALKNRELREEKSNTQVIDEWGVGKTIPVVSEFDDAISLGPQNFVTHTYTTLFLILARKITTTNTVNDKELSYAKEEAVRSIYQDVYGELMIELDLIMYHMEFSGKKEAQSQLSDLIKRWSLYK